MGIYDIIGILTILLATAALIFWNVRHQKNSALQLKCLEVMMRK